MTQAIRYALLGFLTALTLQLFRDPPAWALVVAFIAGTWLGVAIAAIVFWVDDRIVEFEKELEK